MISSKTCINRFSTQIHFLSCQSVWIPLSKCGNLASKNESTSKTSECVRWWNSCHENANYMNNMLFFRNEEHRNPNTPGNDNCKYTLAVISTWHLPDGKGSSLETVKQKKIFHPDLLPKAALKPLEVAKNKRFYYWFLHKPSWSQPLFIPYRLSKGWDLHYVTLCVR